MKKIFNLFFIGVGLAVTSCSELPEYELPYELSETSRVDLTVSATASNALCPGPAATFTVDSEADVYYVIALPEDEAWTSQEIWEDGDVVSFEAAGSETIDLAGLGLGEGYMIYATTVNQNGTRTEEVFTTSVTVPTFDDVVTANVGTEFTATTRYNGSPISQFPLTLNADGDFAFSTNDVWGDDFIATLTSNPAYTGAFPYPATLTVNPDFTVDVTSEVDLGGSGTFDPCTQTFNLALTTNLFGEPFVPFTVTLEPASAE